MNRRRLKNSFVAAGDSLLAGRGFTAEATLLQEQIPEVVPAGEIAKARFPKDFIWGAATAQVEGASVCSREGL